MADRVTGAARRRWANVVIIVAGVYALLMAVWGPPAAGPEQAREAAHQGQWWWAQWLGAILAVASVPVALKVPTLARIMAAAGGIILLIGLAAWDSINFTAIRTLALPGLVILVAAFFMGPMPTPEQEGKPRSGLGSRREP